MSLERTFQENITQKYKIGKNVSGKHNRGKVLCWKIKVEKITHL